MQGFTLPPIIRGVVNWLFLASFMLLSVTAQAGNWTVTNSMSTTRHSHTATVLPNGKVLITGGYRYHDFGVLNTALLYNPANGTWSDADWMNTQRTWHTATLLPNGKVLVTGGETSCCSPTSTAELYDPNTDTWSNTGSMHTPRTIHTATLLPNGKVLVAGGYGSGTTNSELYDPATGTWTVTGSMHKERIWPAATLLQNGKVLVTGGNVTGTSAELYNSATGEWSVTGSMSVVHTSHSAILLPNGKVLVAGGNNTTAELYNPATGTWTTTGAMHEARSTLLATVLLPDGKVLIAGGWGGSNIGTFHTLASAELYNPITGIWTTTGSMNMRRSTFSISLLPNGKVLVAGGEKNNSGSTAVTIASAELYTPGPDLIATTTTLTSSLNPSGLNQNVTFTATVTATTVPTGMVTFKVDGVTKAAKSLNNGQTTYATNTLTIGNRTIRAEYAGNTTWSPSNAELIQVVNSGKDFIITSLAANPFVTPLGQAPTVRVVIKNQGVTAGAGGTLSLWLDRTTGATCNTASDKNVAIGTLAAGASKTINVSGFTPPTVGSLKMLRAFVDSTCATVETNETNNQAVRNYWVGIPDLTVTSITVNSNFPVVANSTFTAQIVVKNQGTAALSSTSFVDLWLNQAIRQNCDAEGDRWEEIGTLAAGASQTITFSDLPTDTTGAKIMRAYVDSWCEREDANRSNNQLTKSYTVHQL